MHPAENALSKSIDSLSPSQHRLERNNRLPWAAVGGKYTTPVGGTWPAGTTQSCNSIGKMQLPTSSDDPAARSGTIIDQALKVLMNVVADEPQSEAPSRKIAKKRRKENDEDGLSSSIHHTTSSKEYLRKVQESLRRDHEDASSDTESSSSHDDQPVPIVGQTNPSLQPVRGSEARRSRNFSPKNHQRTNDDAAIQDETASNPYGYEDPDEVMPSRSSGGDNRAGTYRRRGSVTKFSLQASAAAAAATDRIMRLGLSRIESPRGLRMRSILDKRLLSTCPPPPPPPGDILRLESPTSQKMTLQQPVTTPIESSPRIATTVVGEGSSSPDYQSTDKEGRVFVQSPRNRRGIRSAILRRHSAGSNMERASTSTCSSRKYYGYEDIDSKGKGTNVYGYEDPDSVLESRKRLALNSSLGDSTGSIKVPSPGGIPRRRVARRGSVTKFSLEAAKIVTLNHAQQEPKNTQPIAHDRADQHPGRNYDTTPKSQASARAENCVPRSNEFHIHHRGRSDRAAEKDCNGLSDSEESSDIDSVASFGDDADNAPSIPRRIGSLDSDASSLAPDLRSFCSISRAEAGPTIPPPPPMLLNRTPTPTNKLRKSPMTMTPKVASRQFTRGALSPKGAQASDFKEIFNRGRSSICSGGAVPQVTFPDTNNHQQRKTRNPTSGLSVPPLGSPRRS